MNDWKHSNFMHTSNPVKIGEDACLFVFVLFFAVGRCETMSVVSCGKDELTTLPLHFVQIIM